MLDWLARSPTTALVLGLLLLCGCRQREKTLAVQIDDEDAATLVSVIHMGDPKAEGQLLEGFYNVESNAWRWTKGKFAVALRPPRNAETRGAILHLKFVLPETVVSKVKKISLAAAVSGSVLPPETYHQPGEFDYSREVKPELLTGDVVNVEFTMDNFLHAGEVEQRELGVIALSAGFESKGLKPDNK